jgi:hypothetical protein
MKIAEGGSEIKFDPSWWVTPKTGEDLKLYLDTEHFVGAEHQIFHHMPRPLIIEVIPKPSIWERLNAFFIHAKETVENATGLAKALGTLFSAILAWGIWDVIRKWRAARGGRAAAAP